MKIFNRNMKPQVTPRDIEALRRSAARGGLSVKADDPAAAAAAKKLLETPPAPPPSPGPSGEVERLSIAKIINAFSATAKTPVWEFDDEVLTARTLPSDREAELSLFALHMLYYQAAAITPYAPVTGSRSTAGAITLSAAHAAKVPQIVPGILLEFSVTPDSSTLGQFSGNVVGHYYGGRGIALSNGPVSIDSPATDFDSGTFIFVPKTNKAKGQVILTPFKVVNGKTFLTPLVLAPALTIGAAAATIVVNVATLPSNSLVEATALGVDHDFFNRMATRLHVELD